MLQLCHNPIRRSSYFPKYRFWLEFAQESDTSFWSDYHSGGYTENGGWRIGRDWQSQPSKSNQYILQPTQQCRRIVGLDSQGCKAHLQLLISYQRSWRKIQKSKEKT